MTTRAELNAVARRCSNWPGIVRALRATELADARSESPLESVSRLELSRLGVPAPALQAEIDSSAGTFIGRADFYWSEFGVVGEADGVSKYDLSPNSLLDEKRRQERLEDAGLIVIRWGWDDLRYSARLKDRLVRAFERGHRQRQAGFHPEWSVRDPPSEPPR